jgi:hypothetical protein
VLPIGWLCVTLKNPEVEDPSLLQHVGSKAALFQRLTVPHPSTERILRNHSDKRVCVSPFFVTITKYLNVGML